MSIDNVFGHVIAVTNQKGGVGKTTTSANLAQALIISDPDLPVIVIDGDPQGNLTQAFGIPEGTIRVSLGEILHDRTLPIEAAIYRGVGLDLLPAKKNLADIGAEMSNRTNGELRLKQRVNELRTKYGFIIIDTAPSFGFHLNSALNAADSLVIPVDSGVFAVHGIKSLLGEIEEIKLGTNPNLKILGFLLTLADGTNISDSVFDSLIESFGDQVLETRIRRTTKLKEAPALGKTIFHHAPQSSGAEDYMALAKEVMTKLSRSKVTGEIKPPSTYSVQGVSHV